MAQQTERPSRREHWGTRLGFICAAIGSAVGLGNVWRFPYITGENGGAAFIVIYLLCIVLCGLPIMIAELTIGRKAQSDAVGSFQILGPGKPWYLAGFLAVLAGFFILSFYSVVAGWALKYFVAAVSGQLWSVDKAGFGGYFGQFIATSWEPIFWQGLMMVATVYIVAGGVENGLERWNEILIPMLAVLVIGIAIYSLTLEGASKGLAFLFSPDWSKLADPNVYLTALGQAFFSLSIGMAVFVTYGSYLTRGMSIPRMATMTAAGDTIFAIIAGIAIFPAVFAFGLNPGAGPGLTFITLPSLFQTMPGGAVVGPLFFILLVFAALTSMASLLEVPVSYFMRVLKAPRRRCTVITGVVIFAIGIPSSLGFGVLKHVKWGERSILDILDFLMVNLALPLGGMIIALFVGWAWQKGTVLRDTDFDGNWLGHAWIWLLRVVAPVMVLFVLLQKLGLV
jgi:NSS family neurotransmitter:Na+ symporter